MSRKDFVVLKKILTKQAIKSLFYKYHTLNLKYTVRRIVKNTNSYTHTYIYTHIGCDSSIIITTAHLEILVFTI